MQNRATALEIQVNGRRHRVQASPETPLLYVLRNELTLNGPKFGCGLAQCGACTVHLGGEAIRSCMTPVSAAASAPVVTIEGLAAASGAAGGARHPLQEAFVQEQAGQCGYCLSGMIMSAAALLAKTPKPTDPQVRDALNGNLCRCASHMRILRAVRRAAGQAAPVSPGRSAAGQADDADRSDYSAHSDHSAHSDSLDHLEQSDRAERSHHGDRADRAEHALRVARDEDVIAQEVRR